MASSIGDYAETKLLDAIFNHTTTGGGLPSANIFVSLHTSTGPAETGANEVTGGSYIRQQAEFDAAASGATANTAIIDFTSMPSCTVTAVGIWDAETVGNFLWGGDLSASKVVNSGDTFRIPAGDLDVTLS